MPFLPFFQSRTQKPDSARLPVRAEIVGRRAGRAGVLASICMALVGVILGAAASYLGGHANSVSARYSGYERIRGFEIEQQKKQFRSGLRIGGANSGFNANRQNEPFVNSVVRHGALREGTIGQGPERKRIVDEVVRGDAARAPADPTVSALVGSSSESSAPVGAGYGVTRPRVAIIFDDIGPDRSAFQRIVNMPGPLTLSFLPYAKNIQAMVDEASALDHAIMLHLPMEPLGPQNPGPHALKMGSSAKKFHNDLQWNLDRFTGYRGVNNHMGSSVTANKKKMTKVLAAMKRRGLYFVDSVTTAKTVVPEVAMNSGVSVLSRDVFLDPEAGAATVRRQLLQVEEIARRTGYAIAIAHPHEDTLNMLGPWLTSASLRGFDLVTVDALVADERARRVKG